MLVDHRPCPAARRVGRTLTPSEPSPSIGPGASGARGPGPAGAGLRARGRRAPDADAEFVVRARDGDQDAFAVLVRRHDPGMRRLAHRMLADRAALDDVLVEVYRRAFHLLPAYSGHAPFAAWLGRVAQLVCADELRRPVGGPRPGSGHAVRLAGGEGFGTGGPARPDADPGHRPGFWSDLERRLEQAPPAG